MALGPSTIEFIYKSFQYYEDYSASFPGTPVLQNVKNQLVDQEAALHALDSSFNLAEANDVADKYDQVPPNKRDDFKSCFTGDKTAQQCLAEVTKEREFPKLTLNPGVLTGIGWGEISSGANPAISTALYFNPYLQLKSFLDTFSNFWDQSTIVQITETDPITNQPVIDPNTGKQKVREERRQLPSNFFGPDTTVHLADGYLYLDTREDDKKLLPVRLQLWFGAYRARLFYRNFWGYAPLADLMARIQHPLYPNIDPPSPLHNAQFGTHLRVSKKLGICTVGGAFGVWDGGKPTPWVRYRQPFQVAGQPEKPSTTEHIGQMEPGGYRIMGAFDFGCQSRSADFGIQLSMGKYHQWLPKIISMDADGNEKVTPARDGVQQYVLHWGMALTLKGLWDSSAHTDGTGTKLGIMEFPRFTTSFYADGASAIDKETKDPASIVSRKGLRFEYTFSEKRTPEFETDPATGKPTVKYEKDPKGDKIIDKKSNLPRIKSKLGSNLKGSLTLAYMLLRAQQNVSLGGDDYIIGDLRLPSDSRVNNSTSGNKPGMPGDIPCDPAVCGNPNQPMTPGNANDPIPVDRKKLITENSHRLALMLALDKTWNVASWGPIVFGGYLAGTFVIDPYGKRPGVGGGLVLKF